MGSEMCIRDSYNTTVRTIQSIMPSSPHSVVPTSTVHPMPPAPHPGNFSVKGKNGKVCLVADMAATFDVEAKPKVCKRILKYFFVIRKKRRQILILIIIIIS